MLFVSIGNLLDFYHTSKIIEVKILFFEKGLLFMKIPYSLWEQIMSF